MVKPKLPVLYITYDGLTDPLGQSQILPYLTSINQQYSEMTILSAEKKVNFIKNKEAIQAILKDTTIQWEHIQYHRSPPIVSTLLDVRKMWKKASNICQKGPVIVHCRSYIAALIGLRLKKKYGARLIFDMRGFWADERVDGKIWNLSNPIFKLVYNFFKKKEKAFFETSDTIVSLTSVGKHEICNNFDVAPEAITVIPCCVDRNLFDPATIHNKTISNLQEKLGIHAEDLVITYLGSIGTWYLVDEMFDFFRQLKEEETTARFLFVTNDEPASILELAKKAGVDTNDILITNARRNEVPALLKLSDIGLFFIKQSYSKLASSPTKMGEFLSMGVPIIGNDKVGDVAEMIDDAGCGLVVREFNKAHYQSCLAELDQLRNTNPAIMQQAAGKYFDLEMGIKRYLSIYDSL